jgi:hypothetical protein
MKVLPAVAVAVITVASTTLLTPAGALALRPEQTPRPRVLVRPTTVEPTRARTVAARSELFGGPGKWTKLSSGTGGGLNEPGLLRTSDGKLHVVWLKETSPSDWSLGDNTISRTGVLLHTGVAVAHWDSIQYTPRLVPDGKDIRLILNGNRTTSGSDPYSRSARYSALSANGSTWTLQGGSLSSHATFNMPLAATTEANGTPVSAEGLNDQYYYHVGIDAAVPAATPDQSISGPVGAALEYATLVRNKDGSIYLAWWQAFKGQGYHVQRLLPTKTAAVKAPGSGSDSPSAGNNAPNQSVAMAARVGGGVYVAYCVETTGVNCAHVAIWKVGSKTAKVVPGSSGGTASHVTLSAGTKGRMVIGWYNTSKNVIDVVRTNTAVSAFDSVRVVKPPAHTEAVIGLFTESSSGRIDIVANVQQASSGFPIAFFHTQVLAGLKISASPTKFSHASAHTVTFKVTDAGQAVPGATVTFLGKREKTNSAGVAKFKEAKGRPKGSHSAVASKTDYFSGDAAVKIT